MSPSADSMPPLFVSREFDPPFLTRRITGAVEAGSPLVMKGS
jgi:hypothetical protein